MNVFKNKVEKILKFFLNFLNIFFFYVHNKDIRLIIVEPRVLIDIDLFINIRTKIYYSVLNIL